MEKSELKDFSEYTKDFGEESL